MYSVGVVWKGVVKEGRGRGEGGGREGRGKLEGCVVRVREKEKEGCCIEGYVVGK